MEITGKIIAALPPRTGTSSRGKAWQSNTYVLETQEQYPKRVAFDVFGAERIAQFGIQLGETLTVAIDIDAHEYNGRWYNQIRAWNVSRVPTAQPVGTTVLPSAQVGPQGSALFAQTPPPGGPPQTPPQSASNGWPF